MSLPIGTPDNTKTPQEVSIDPSSGDLVVLPNYDLPTYGNVIGVNASKNISISAIGQNGEVAPLPYVKPAETTKSMWSEIRGEVIVGVLVAVISGIILLAIIRRG